MSCTQGDMGEENKQNKPSICTDFVVGKLNDKTTFNKCQEFLRFIEMLKQACGVQGGGMRKPESGNLVEFRLEKMVEKTRKVNSRPQFPPLFSIIVSSGDVATS